MKKIVVITGVGKGFGRELAVFLAKDFHIIGISRSAEDIGSLSEELRQKTDDFDLIEADVSDFKKTSELLTELLNKKSNSLYGLINNAGVRCRKNILDLTMEEIIDVSNVNLFAVINLTKTVIPYFIKSGSGRIINISSILSQSAMSDLSAYAVSKGGLDAFTRSMAVELGSKKIAVNSILPGFCKTSYYPQFSKNEELLNMTLEKIPMGRWGESDELIGICEFLLSERSSYITGASIPIDGGWLA